MKSVAPLVAFVGAGALGVAGYFGIRLRGHFALALVGVGATCMLVFSLLAATVGIKNYLDWTFLYAWKSSNGPPLGPLLQIWTWPPARYATLSVLLGWSVFLKSDDRSWGRGIARGLFFLPMGIALVRGPALLTALWPSAFLSGGIIAARLFRRGARVESMVLFLSLAAALGALCSQGLRGSTYALGPFLVLWLSAAFRRWRAGEAEMTWHERGLIFLIFLIGWMEARNATPLAP